MGMKYSSDAIPSRPTIAKTLRRRIVGALRVLELCAGAGGQALGMESAGFEHAGLVEIDKNACITLRHNRPRWNVIQADLHEFYAREFQEVLMWYAADCRVRLFPWQGNSWGVKTKETCFRRPFALSVKRSPKW